MKYFIAVISALAFFSCGPKPFLVKHISPKETSIPSPTLKEEYSETKKAHLKELNVKANKPSFGLIKGFYKLPSTKPEGASLVIESFNALGRVSIVERKNDNRDDFVITPLDGEEALSMAKAINHLLDADIKLMEISLTDALSIAQEEKKTLQKKEVLNLKKTLSPNVDYLVSLDEIYTKDGRQILGRIIKSDGKLIAFKVMPKIHSESLGVLLLALMEEGLSRIRHEK